MQHSQYKKQQVERDTYRPLQVPQSTSIPQDHLQHRNLTHRHPRQRYSYLHLEFQARIADPISPLFPFSPQSHKFLFQTLQKLPNPNSQPSSGRCLTIWLTMCIIAFPRLFIPSQQLRPETYLTYLGPCMPMTNN